MADPMNSGMVGNPGQSPQITGLTPNGVSFPQLQQLLQLLPLLAQQPQQRPFSNVINYAPPSTPQKPQPAGPYQSIDQLGVRG